MEKQKILKILTTLIILLISIGAQAACICLVDKSDIKTDMQKIAEKLDTVYATDATTLSVNKIFDNQQLKVDRTDPFLKQVNAVGVIKAQPNSVNHATAILISPCHILVNAHAVTNLKAKKSLEYVYISIGQSSCDSPKEFDYQDIDGKVIAIGDISEDETKISDSYDYAIVKLPRDIQNIEIPIISVVRIYATASLVKVGFPENSTSLQKTGLRYPTANFVKQTRFHKNGTFTYSNNTKQEGSSGSGVFVLDRTDDGIRQVVLSGIHVGLNDYGAIGLQTASILKDLKSKNPEVYNQLKSSIEKNSCNLTLHLQKTIC